MHADAFAELLLCPAALISELREVIHGSAAAFIREAYRNRRDRHNFVLDFWWWVSNTHAVIRILQDQPERIEMTLAGERVGVAHGVENVCRAKGILEFDDWRAMDSSPLEAETKTQRWLRSREEYWS
jgi:hypothetical protein